MIDIREHGGIFGGGKYRKNMELGMFGDLASSSFIQWKQSINNSNFGDFSPKINKIKNYIFWICGNAHSNIKTPVFDINTKTLKYCAYSQSYSDYSLVDSLGNSYIGVKSDGSLSRIKDDFSASIWSVSAGVNAFTSSETWWSLDDGSSILLFDEFYKNKALWVNIETGQTTTMNFSSGDPRGENLQGVYVSKKQNCVYAYSYSNLYKFNKSFTTLIWKKSFSYPGMTVSPYTSMVIDEETETIYFLTDDETNTNQKVFWKLNSNGEIVVGPVVHHSLNGNGLNGQVPGYLKNISKFFIRNNQLFMYNTNNSYYSIDTNTLLATGNIITLPIAIGRRTESAVYSYNSSELLIAKQGQTDSVYSMAAKVKLL